MIKSTLRNVLLVVATIAASGGSAPAQTKISSTYVGDPGGNWSAPGNWMPQIVPNNDASHSFDVTVGATFPGVILDVDVKLSSLTLNDDVLATVLMTDHNLTSATTSVGVDFAGEPYGGGAIFFQPLHKSVFANLGNLADFSGTTLGSGNYFVSTIGADPGVTATLQFNGANIVSNGADLQMGGVGAFYRDEHGNDALAHFAHNLPSGVFDQEDGANFTTGPLLNEGEWHVFGIFTGTPTDPGDHGFSALTTLTVNGDLTMLGPDGEGYMEMIAKGAGKDAQVKVNGVITDYDPATKTLTGGLYEMTAGEGAACSVQMLGTPFDIVDIESFLSLIGPNTGFRDSAGSDALRHLAQTGPSAFFRIGDRTFTTAGTFTSAGILTIRGNGVFAVSGNLNVTGGLLHVSEKTGYDFEGLVDTYAGATEFGNALATVAGNLTLDESATTRFDLTSSAKTATVQVAGRAALAGDLTIFLITGNDGAPVNPTTGNGRTLLTASSLSGSFANAKSGERVLAYTADSVVSGRFNGKIVGTYKASYDTTTLQLSDFQPHSSLLNIATRLNVKTGDNEGIGGFIIRGGAAKKMLIRGMGPSLASRGVSGVLQDPTLELHDSTGAVIATNDNWQDSQEDDINATGISPVDPKESAIFASLDPGSYTAVIRGANGTTGIGLIEIYDVNDQPSPAEFANLSTRGRVEKADNVMIGGAIIGAGAPAALVVRALGPSLAGKGVPSPLLDPTLEIHDASGATIASNDNWLENNPTSFREFESLGLAPTDFRESALKVTLPPGSYTAIVRGKNDTQGAALVEFYKLN